MQLSTKISSNEINEIIYKGSEKLLLHWVEEYKRDPRCVIDCFLKYESIRMSVTLITFWARKKGVLSELEGKSFEDYVSRLPLEEKWKRVLEKFLLVLYGCLK